MTLILRNNALLVRGNSLATSTQCCCQPTPPTPCLCPTNVISEAVVDGLTIATGQTKTKKQPFACAYGTPPIPGNTPDQYFCGKSIVATNFGLALTASVGAETYWIPQTGICAFGITWRAWALATVQISYCPSGIANFFTSTSLDAGWQLLNVPFSSDNSVSSNSQTFSTPSTQCQPPNGVAQLPMSITCARPTYTSNGSEDLNNLDCGVPVAPKVVELADLVADIVAGINFTVNPGPP